MDVQKLIDSFKKSNKLNNIINIECANVLDLFLVNTTQIKIFFIPSKVEDDDKDILNYITITVYNIFSTMYIEYGEITNKREPKIACSLCYLFAQKIEFTKLINSIINHEFIHPYDYIKRYCENWKRFDKIRIYEI